MFDVSNLGQVFTPTNIVNLMLNLKMKSGRTLEPSSGDGSFSKRIPSCISIEIDTNHADEHTLVMDFFDYDTSQKYDTIIGNPPYVRYQDINESTKVKLSSQSFDSRSNLYLFFIEKSLDHLNSQGELIFIVPRDFLKSTSSRHLNKYLFSLGTITHLIDLGDSRIFTRAVPNCVVFRFEKDNFTRVTKSALLNVRNGESVELSQIQWKEKYFQEVSGQLIFSDSASKLQLCDLADVRVGAVSGLDKIFANEEFGNREFVFSETAKTGLTRKMIWVDSQDKIPKYLSDNKLELMSRKIRKFDESNWWEWGRGFPDNSFPRVYVNAKTRNQNPFFLHSCKNFDGSVLAIFPKYEINLDSFVKDLNSIAWDDLGFFCDGRFIFAQRSLENAPVPEFMRKYFYN